MTQPTKPPKHLKRAFVDNRTHAEPDPQPSPEDIQRGLGLVIPRNDEVERE